MAIATLTPRTSVTTLNETSISGRTVVQPTTWYTCPAGKKARVTCRIQNTGRGAATNADFNAAGILIYRFVAGVWVAGTNEFISDPRAVGMDLSPISPENTFDLTAGETITTTQDSGTNAEFNLYGHVIELPA